MARDRDDRRERDWRAIDRNKDRSRHRQEDRPAGRDPRRAARAASASQVYRSKLDSFFDGDGAAPPHVKEKLAALDASPQGKKRKAALEAIQNAATSTAVARATSAFLAGYELPPDHDVLVQVLTSGDEEHQRAALDAVGELLENGRPPRRTAVLEQRLKRIIDLGEEPDVIERAEAVLGRLRAFSR